MESDVTGEFLELNDMNCARFVIQGQVDIQLATPGKHQVYNALAAATIGIYWKIPLETIADVLEKYTSFSKRMEQIKFKNAMILLDAYNSNPDSLKPALESLGFLASKRKGRAIAVLGDMLELGELSESISRCPTLTWRVVEHILSNCGGDRKKRYSPLDRCGEVVVIYGD